MPNDTLTWELPDWRCAARVSGPPTGRPTLLLHGFPDTAHTFDDLRAALANDGRYVAAPFMRGIAPSSVPANGRFDVRALAEDVVAFADQLEAESVDVVGHDWGAVAAYTAAALFPDRIRRVVLAAVPPPASVLGARDPKQLWRSAYMAAFQAPRIAEAALARNDFQPVEQLWRRWSPSWSFTADDLEPVKRAYRAPGSLRAALGYYRALPRAIARDHATRRAALGPIQAPLMLISGLEDGCMGQSVMAHAARTLPADAHVALPAGHFIHRECPDAFIAAVRRHLDAD